MRGYLGHAMKHETAFSVTHKRGAPHCSLDPCQHQLQASSAHKAVLVFSSHFLTSPTYSSFGHSLQDKRLRDHEIVLPFFLFFRAALTPSFLCYPEVMTCLALLSPTSFLDICLTSCSIYLGSFIAGCDSLPSKIQQLDGCGKNLIQCMKIIQNHIYSQISQLYSDGAGIYCTPFAEKGICLAYQHETEYITTFLFLFSLLCI